MLYAIYTRQSVEPRDGLSSCEAQFHVCRGFARAMARPGDSWIGERFDDEGVSGRTLDRPSLSRLRERIREGGIHLVYAVALDRHSRTVTHTVQLLDEIERAGVEVHVAFQPELGSDPESRLLRHILASFAQFEREIIAARIPETRAYLKRHGRRLAGPAPYACDANPGRQAACAESRGGPARPRDLQAAHRGPDTRRDRTAHRPPRLADHAVGGRQYHNSRRF